MLFSKEKDEATKNKLTSYIKSKNFQRILIGTLTLLIAFVIILNGAMPEKYKLNLGDASKYNITAPRDIEDKTKTSLNEAAAAAAVGPVMIDIKGASVDVVTAANDFITAVETERDGIEKSFQDKGISKKDKDYKKLLSEAQTGAVDRLTKKVEKLGVPLSNDQIYFLIAKAGDEEVDRFKNILIQLISTTVRSDITSDNLPKQILNAQNLFQVSELNQEFKNIGGAVIKAILKPNKTINNEQTNEKKLEARKDPKNKEIILKGKTIISVGDIVTSDKFEILRDLNLLEESRFDFGLAAGIFIILLLLTVLLVLYMSNFCKDILDSLNDLILLSLIILLTLLLARGLIEFSILAVPICLAAMLISILLDLKLSIMVNFILTIAISFITKGDLMLIYVSLISGTFAAFIVSKANQRNRLFATGIVIATINVLIIICFGIINKSELSDIIRESAIVSLNGILSIIFTIGLLPFWESAFNVITPVKLMELANPNQPLIKKLLMEAPGTYHHSLMVGNLAEVATEIIGGNALLARVGAYFHDIGKLKRPNFFIENQMSENPHDRMTANLSTLVITSHTKDGVDIAKKYKIPLAIREIISQHHGNTLVAYFYHKAKKGEKGEEVKQENFRYEGPKPTSKEAAVVMLADSVEAAVRSMIDKTEGKIEGLIRKIIKDKLDDGQLDLCSLTLKDLDDIAKGFMKVLSGYFHEREEYPEIKIRPSNMEELAAVVPTGDTVKRVKTEEGSAAGESTN